jgi:integrase/recombinase XerD
LRAYLAFAGHGDDIDGPLFRPLRPNGKRQDERRPMDPDAIDRVVRKFATALGLDRGYSAHSMRATFINHGARERRQARGRAEGRRSS